MTWDFDSWDVKYNVNHRRITLKDDWDLSGACDDWPSELKMEEIDHVIARLDGQRDEINWEWILALKDGTFAYADAWCDYTGWG